MANPRPLTDSKLNQALSTIHKVKDFDGNPEDLSSFVNEIEFILSLYNTPDVGQQRHLYGAIFILVTGDARRTAKRNRPKTWIELKTSITRRYMTKTSYEELLSNLYNVEFKGSLRKFVKELEDKAI
ncbi:hypothetical protein KR038_006608, partial [Drosophila bunnanda]